MKSTFIIKATLSLVLLLSVSGVFAQHDFSTGYFKIHINNKGFITSMKNTTVKHNREFSPADNPSPLMSLSDSKKNVYYQPTKATYSKESKKLALRYPNGSVATILMAPQKKYFKLTLQSLSPRNGADVIQWGSIHTNITNLMGEIIGVSRDTS